MGWEWGILQELQGMPTPGEHAAWVDGEKQCYWRADAGSAREHIDENDGHRKCTLLDMQINIIIRPADPFGTTKQLFLHHDLRARPFRLPLLCYLPRRDISSSPVMQPVAASTLVLCLVSQEEELFLTSA